VARNVGPGDATVHPDGFRGAMVREAPWARLDPLQADERPWATVGLGASDDARPAVAADEEPPEPAAEAAERSAGPAQDVQARGVPSLQLQPRVEPALEVVPCTPGAARSAGRSCGAAEPRVRLASRAQPTRARTAEPMVQRVALKRVLWILLGSRPAAEPRDLPVLARTTLTRQAPPSEQPVSPLAEPVESPQQAALLRDGRRFAV